MYKNIWHEMFITSDENDIIWVFILYNDISYQCRFQFSSWFPFGPSVAHFSIAHRWHHHHNLRMARDTFILCAGCPSKIHYFLSVENNLEFSSCFPFFTVNKNIFHTTPSTVYIMARFRACSFLISINITE